MRSPRSAPFPAVVLILLLGLATACTPAEEEPAGTRTTPAVERTEDAQPEEDGAGSPRTGQEPEGSASTVVDGDARRTTSGTAPPYVEIDSVEAEASIDRLSLSMRLRGPVPERMLDAKSILRIGFKLTMKTGESFMFDAQCLADGWSTSASGGPEGSPSPALEVDTERGKVTLLVDPAYIGGPQPFQWISTVSWSGRDGDYAFDVAPATGMASYP